MRHPRIAGAVVALTVLAGVALWLAAGDRSAPPRPVPQVRFAVSNVSLSAPVFVAKSLHMFAREGLAVELVPTTSGKAALAAVTAGRADFATVAETPFVFAALAGEPVAIVATIARSSRDSRIVARRDRGLDQPEAHAGKRIGVTRGTAGEYFLDALLTYHLLPRTAVQRVDLAPEALVEALAEGHVDAVSTWQPLVARAADRLGADALVLGNDLIYNISWNIAARPEYVREHGDTVQRLLRALLSAQAAIREAPNLAAEVMRERVGPHAAPLRDIEFDIRLSGALLLDLDAEARWALRTGLAEAGALPDFASLLHPGPLGRVSPDSVGPDLKASQP